MAKCSAFAAAKRIVGKPQELLYQVNFMNFIVSYLKALKHCDLGQHRFLFKTSTFCGMTKNPLCTVPGKTVQHIYRLQGLLRGSSPIEECNSPLNSGKVLKLVGTTQGLSFSHHL